MADTNLKFRSFVGDQPWFFVPDTGTPGGTAVVSGGPEGAVEAVQTQTTTGENSSFGPRVGFQVPFPFAAVGSYQFVVTQDDVVTTYEIEVVERTTDKEIANG
jgi:hypothetical protein